MEFLGYVLLFLVFAAGTFASWHRYYSKQGVVGRYAIYVGRTLALRCGAASSYRATDVTRALLTARVSTSHAPYAYALFCDETEFAKAPGCAGLEYAELRREAKVLAVWGRSEA